MDEIFIGWLFLQLVIVISFGLAKFLEWLIEELGKDKQLSKV